MTHVSNIPGIEMLAGVHRDVPFDVYHAWNAASNSRLSKLERSAAHLKDYLDHPPSDTKATRVGRAVHTAVLEPDHFATTFTVADQCEATKKGDGLRCSNLGIMFRLDLGWLCGVHGKGLNGDESRVILSADEYATCIGARDSVRRHPAARAMLDRLADIELSMVWRDSATDILCKGRFDGHAPAIDNGLAIDVKTTEDASKSAFERTIYKFGYHRQGAHYLDGAAANGLAVEHYVNIAVEKTRPFAVACYQLSDVAVELGREQLLRQKTQYARCLERDEWPAYSDGVQEITLPAYAFSQIDQQLSESQ